MCAAVIGRQLRQQAVLGRTSNPLLSAQIPSNKHRPKAPSNILISGKPQNPIPCSIRNTSNDLANYTTYLNLNTNRNKSNTITFPVLPYSNRPKVTSKLTSNSETNAVIAQREQRNLAAQLKKLNSQKAKVKLRCTWHCFCIALKALSCGLILFTVGTILSIIGFLKESHLKQIHASARSNNSTIKLSNNNLDLLHNQENLISLLNKSVHINEEVYSRIRNLTFAGPVMMGLGGIMILAALVLTFESRDTLGIKDENFNKKIKHQKQDLTYNSENNQLEKPKVLDHKLSCPQSFKHSTLNQSNLRKLSTIELKKSYENLRNKRHFSSASILINNKNLNKLTKSSKQFTKQEFKFKNSIYDHKKDFLETNLDNEMLKLNHETINRNISMTFSIDSFDLYSDLIQTEKLYFGTLKSPQETDLSDAESSEFSVLNTSSKLNSYSNCIKKTCSFYSDIDYDQDNLTFDSYSDNQLTNNELI